MGEKQSLRIESKSRTGWEKSKRKERKLLMALEKEV